MKLDDMKPYCTDYYKPNTLAKAYEVVISSLTDRKDWHVPQDVMEELIEPPKYKRPLGSLKN